MEQPLKFDDYKGKIQAAIDEGLKSGNLFTGEKTVSLIPGFFTLPLRAEYDKSIVLGGEHVPMVAVLGGSGRMYFFALKQLIPGLGE